MSDRRYIYGSMVDINMTKVHRHCHAPEQTLHKEKKAKFKIRLNILLFDVDFIFLLGRTKTRSTYMLKGKLT
jgi:hypothetical protein